MTQPFNSITRPLNLICLVAVVLLIGSASARSQEHVEASFEPVRFVEASGDSFYFDHVRGRNFLVWRDRWILAVNTPECYLADTQTLSVTRLGREGRGPGEFVRAFGISARGDTAMITHDLIYTSHFLLPSGLFLWRDEATTGERPRNQLWISDDMYLSANLPRHIREQGLYGRFNLGGELLQAYGEHDDAERFESNEYAIQMVNGGFLGIMPDGNTAFIYIHLGVLAIYSPQGELLNTTRLEIPWNDRDFTNPVKNPRGPGWSGRGLFESLQVVEDGFLVACRGFKRREGIMRNYVATYSWDGDLTRVIHLPLHDDPESRPDMLWGVVQIQGELWVAMTEDPLIRKLIIKPN